LLRYGENVQALWRCKIHVKTGVCQCELFSLLAVLACRTETDGNEGSRWSCWKDRRG
jgi:hypothetical protein